MIVRDALQGAAARLAGVSETPGSDAQRLLRAVLKVERVWLMAHPEHELDSSQHEAFAHLVERAAVGEPLPYILGTWVFYDREFRVTPDVLIPRPETELLLEQALAFSADDAITAVDVGTGSGALAVTLAALRPRARVYATDVSHEALAVAAQNAALHAAPVTFLEGDLLQPLIERRLRCHLILANLPYIPGEEVSRLPVSRYEPRLALDGGPDGLAIIRRLLGQIPAAADAGALILMEIMAGQGGALTAEVRARLPGSIVEILPDYAGHDRIARIQVA
ncbi:MAG: peptide chain release factor N(5)-glutamine methyltransferase [Anaerolineae bacterium]|nr:peptide chain release factor N(5)-glutamine methyltransferase [Anaerolineae bacterium]